jgi:hypothetical protein
MVSNFLRIALAPLFLFLISPAAPAQQQPPVTVRPANPVPPQPGTTTQATYRAKQVLGSKVMIQGNTAVGTVEDLVFDDAGNLEYMVVSHDGKLVTMPWEAGHFNPTDRVITAGGITATQFNTIPTYTTTTYPEFYSPTYRNQIYKSYGLTPRELRRLERRGQLP